ncbi:MAG: hypothetical protein KKC76_14060 [Proteobacteria bacterium]|nr:hypothetical protein [Pseudomonadota bacterium]MBU4298306.1 hypothetical protein [Pseudomonadota bacterium]MCG2749692.1 RAMP superfamily CRISPR-associated protein [Desulfobulbaceae bacterium]
MIRIGFRITTKSPLLITAGPPAYNLLETLDFIPGNTMRGFLAHRYLSQGGKADDVLFNTLFLSGEVRYGCSTINGAQVIPLSARSCKYYGGFLGNGKLDPPDKETHGVVDLLLHSGEAKQCPQCGQSVDYFEGHWNSETYSFVQVRKRLITRTAIDPVRGAAASGKLYSQRVIEEGQDFVGVIESPDSCAAALRELLASSSAAGLGRAKSRGQGWVEIVEQEPFALSPSTAANERINFFKDNGPRLAVTFLSDALFQDEFQRDTTAPTVKQLGSLGIKPDEWQELHYEAFAATRLVFGFDGPPLCLPRIPRLAVSAGSVFLFKSKEGMTNPHIPPGNGVGWVGDNNGEGFGLVVLWHPFHYQPDKEIGKNG